MLRDESRRELLTAAEDPASVSATSASHDEMDIFAFETEPEDSYSAEKEVMDYLRSGGYEIETLNQFSNVKNIYMNTPTPSTAPVEWLFSLGGLVFTPGRNRGLRSFC